MYVVYYFSPCRAELKQQAVGLRKDGFTYSEILKQVPVAKSTLALWLQEVGLSTKQKQRITEKRRLAALRGAQKRRDDRILRTAELHDEALRELRSLY